MQTNLAGSHLCKQAWLAAPAGIARPCFLNISLLPFCFIHCMIKVFNEVRRCICAENPHF